MNTVSEHFWIVLAVGVVIVVLVALFFRRKLIIRWGDKSVETGEVERENREMTIRATGTGSLVEKAAQESRGGNRNMQITAESGGKVKDATQRDERKG